MFVQRTSPDERYPDPVPMDCRAFRKNHLAYLDDTLSGDETRAALQHILSCDCCAAHDTLVRRSLMIARSMPGIEPSAEFQSRLRERLASCREDAATKSTMSAQRSPFFSSVRSARAIAVVAVGAVIGTLLWRGTDDAAPPTMAMQPVIASQPAAVEPAFLYSPALISAMSTGNPVWPAAMLMIDEAPTQLVSSDFQLVTDGR